VIVHDLNINRIRIHPAETEPPLIVNPNAVLPSAVAFESLQPIRWNRPKVGEYRCGVHLVEFPLGGRGYALEPTAEFTPIDFRSLGIPERPDRKPSIVP